MKWGWSVLLAFKNQKKFVGGTSHGFLLTFTENGTCEKEINLGDSFNLCISVYNVCVCFVFSVIDDTTKEIVYRDYVDISVAVATPKVRQVHYIVMLSVSA